MAKLLKEYMLVVDTKEATKRFHKLHQETERFGEALNALKEDIKIGIRVVPIEEKKWYQFWKK
jgi:hypothetical protein